MKQSLISPAQIAFTVLLTAAVFAGSRAFSGGPSISADQQQEEKVIRRVVTHTCRPGQACTHSISAPIGDGTAALD
jgi:hypothetical protein